MGQCWLHLSGNSCGIRVGLGVVHTDRAIATTSCHIEEEAAYTAISPSMGEDEEACTSATRDVASHSKGATRSATDATIRANS